MTEHQVSDHVAGKIRDARKQRGWSTDELAERCGLTGNIIENIEGGRRRGGERTRDITVDELCAISWAVGVGPLKLLPSGPRPYSPEDLERARALDQAMKDLDVDHSRLEALDMELGRVIEERRVVTEERRAVEDRIAKTTWLIEQLRESE
jgi:transcriptional regulator with XRE-family HTH domain